MDYDVGDFLIKLFGGPAAPVPAATAVEPKPALVATAAALEAVPVVIGAPQPGPVCPRHPRAGVADVPIHGGRSTRRDCAKCGRFVAWIRWYGRDLHLEAAGPASLEARQCHRAAVGDA